MARAIVKTVGTKTKWQRKFKANNTTADAEITELAFNNLTAGKTYKISFHAHTTNGTSGNNFIVSCYNGTNVLSNLLFTMRQGITNGHEDSAGTSVVFTAVNTTVRFFLTGVQAGDTMYGTGDANGGTWALLEELPDHTSTTEWN